MESRGEELHDEGDASTSRGKKKKQQRRVRNAHGEPETSIQGPRGDESGQGGSPIAIVSEGGRGTSSPIAGEVPSRNPPSGFKPPRQLLNTRSNRRIPRATEPPKAPEIHRVWCMRTLTACRRQKKRYKTKGNHQQLQVEVLQRSRTRHHSKVRLTYLCTCTVKIGTH